MRIREMARHSLTPVRPPARVLESVANMYNSSSENYPYPVIRYRAPTCFRRDIHSPRVTSSDQRLRNCDRSTCVLADVSLPPPRGGRGRGGGGKEKKHRRAPLVADTRRSRGDRNSRAQDRRQPPYTLARKGFSARTRFSIYSRELTFEAP